MHMAITVWANGIMTHPIKCCVGDGPPDPLWSMASHS